MATIMLERKHKEYCIPYEWIGHKKKGSSDNNKPVKFLMNHIQHETRRGRITC